MVRFPSFLPLKNKHRKTKKNDEKKGIRQTVLSWCFGPKGRLIKPWPLIGSLTEDVNTSHQGQYSKAIFNCQLKIRLGWHWLYFLCCEVDREDMGSHSRPIRCKIKTRWVGHAHFSRDFSVLFTPNSHWFLLMCNFIVIGRCDYFGSSFVWLARVHRWRAIKAKINMWRVNFTERRTWFVNWTSLRCDLPFEIYGTRDFSLSLRGNLEISLEYYTQKERFYVFPFNFVTTVF